MTPVTRIDVSRDIEGLRQYLPAFFEEAASATGPRSRPGESFFVIPLGYRRWIEHLFLVENLGANVELTSDEALGLNALRSARDKFAADHTRCGRCGAWMHRSHGYCGPCGWRPKEGER